jgi:hypothetical protein
MNRGRRRPVGSMRKFAFQAGVNRTLDKPQFSQLKGTFLI